MEPSTSSVRKRPFVNNINNSAAKTRSVVPRELRLCLTRVLGYDMPVSEPPKVDEEGSKKRRRCHTCPLKVQRKSTHTCYLCKKHVCLQCSKEVCPDCM